VFGSLASIVTRLRTRRPGFNSRQRQWWDFFLFTTMLRPPLESTQPPIQRVMSVRSPGVRRSGREAGHSFHSRAEVKNSWCLVKHGDKITLLYVTMIFMILPSAVTHRVA